MATMPIGPADWTLRIIGSMFAAKRSASACRARRPAWPASAIFLGFAQGFATLLLGCQCCARALRDEAALLFGQRCVQVQHEGIGVAAQLGNDERNALRHEARDGSNITREPVELRNQHTAPCALGCCQRCRQLRPPIERIGALAGSGLNILAFSVRKSLDRCALSLNSEP